MELVSETARNAVLMMFAYNVNLFITKLLKENVFAILILQLTLLMVADRNAQMALFNFMINLDVYYAKNFFQIVKLVKILLFVSSAKMVLY